MLLLYDDFLSFLVYFIFTYWFFFFHYLLCNVSLLSLFWKKSNMPLIYLLHISFDIMIPLFQHITGLVFEDLWYALVAVVISTFWHMMGSIPRSRLFLHGISLEWTEKLYISFVTQFIFFIFKYCKVQLSHWIRSYTKNIVMFLCLFSKLAHSFVVIALL